MRRSQRLDPAQWLTSAVFAVVVAALIALGGCSGAAAPGRPTLVVFTSPNCVACMQDVPVIKQIATMGLVTLDVINTDEEPRKAEAWGITTLPTYVLIHDWRELYRTSQAELMRRFIKGLYE